MANVTKEIRKEANKATRKKAKHEKKLEKNLKRWNSKVVNEFVVTIARGFPSIMLTTIEKQSLDKLLLRHHLDTAKDFTLFDLNSFAIKQNDGVVTQTENQIAKNILLLIDTRSPEQADFIGTTVENEKQKSLDLASELLVAQSLEDGIPPDRRSLAVTAGAILNSRLNNKVSTTAVTETNWPAEGTRKIHVDVVKEPLAVTLESEAEAIDSDNIPAARALSKTANDLADITYSNTAKTAALLATSAAVFERFTGGLRKAAQKVREQLKIWVTMGDSRVRGSHRAANGQRIPDIQAFQVGSSLLNYPADSSLGAIIAEIVHCRCYVYYN